MNNLTKALQEIKDRAEKNLAEAKQLIQPEQSWIEDNTDLLRLVKALEYAMKCMNDSADDDTVWAGEMREIESILEGKNAK